VRRLSINRKCDAVAGLAFDALQGSVRKLQRRDKALVLPFEAFKDDSSAQRGDAAFVPASFAVLRTYDALACGGG